MGEFRSHFFDGGKSRNSPEAETTSRTQILTATL